MLLKIFKNQFEYGFVDSYRTIHLEKMCDDVESFIHSDSNAIVLCAPPRTGKTSFAVNAVSKYWSVVCPDSNIYHCTYTQNLAETNVKNAKRLMGVDIGLISYETKSIIKAGSLVIVDDPCRPTDSHSIIKKKVEWIAELIKSASIDGGKVLIIANRMHQKEGGTDFIGQLQLLARFDLINYKADESDEHNMTLKSHNPWLFKAMYMQDPS